MPKKNKLLDSVKKVTQAKEKKTWIIIAQRTQAKLIEYSGKGKNLLTIKGFINPAGKLQTRELVSDKPGRSYSQSTGMRRSAMSSSEDAHEHSLTVFAKELAKALSKGLSDHACDRLVLVAEPHCLGKIKENLSTKVQKYIQATVDKDLFRLDNKKLFAKLEDVLR